MSADRCPGTGVIYTDLAMMAGVASTGEECEGKRFQAEVLEYKFGGQDISEVLAMPVAEAIEFFGPGYLSIGQPLTTASGGERQRRARPATW